MWTHTYHCRKCGDFSVTDNNPAPTALPTQHCFIDNRHGTCQIYVKQHVRTTQVGATAPPPPPPTPRQRARDACVQFRNSTAEGTKVCAAVDRTNSGIGPWKGVSGHGLTLAQLHPSLQLAMQGMGASATVTQNTINCAEVQACNKALTNGVALANIVLYVVNRINQAEDVPCDNCRYWLPKSWKA